MLQEFPERPSTQTSRYEVPETMVGIVFETGTP